MIDKLNSVLKSLVLAAAVAFLVSLTVYTIKIGHKISTTADNVQATASHLETLVGVETEFFKSGKIQKAMEQNLQAGELLRSTVALLNTQTIKRVNQNLDSLNTAINSLNTVAQNTDRTINKELAFEAGETIRTLRETVAKNGDTITGDLETLRTQIETTGKAATESMQAIRTAVEDPNLKKIVAEAASVSENANKISGDLAKTSGNIVDTSASLKLAADSAPGIARNVEKFSNSQTKFSWVINGLRVIGLGLGIAKF